MRSMLKNLRLVNEKRLLINHWVFQQSLFHKKGPRLFGTGLEPRTIISRISF